MGGILISFGSACYASARSPGAFWLRRRCCARFVFASHSVPYRHCRNNFPFAEYEIYCLICACVRVFVCSVRRPRHAKAHISCAIVSLRPSSDGQPPPEPPTLPLSEVYASVWVCVCRFVCTRLAAITDTLYILSASEMCVRVLSADSRSVCCALCASIR